MANLSTPINPNPENPQYIKEDDAGEFKTPKGGEWSDLVEQQIYPYYPSDGLIEAVNLAIRLNRPLLLEGEPGCGKSQLAAAVAYQFNKRYNDDIKWKYRLWNIQSTSKAQDGFYTYDYVGRLQAAQLAKEQVKDENLNPSNPANFINWGPLGYAFQEHDCRTIVLIDEIDKADKDLPNDLLLAIDQQKFLVKEITENGKPCWKRANKDAPPIIFITSNREQELPRAFLRRCLYHYVEFPDRKRLTEIINSRFDNPPATIVKPALDKFLKLRTAMEEDELSKQVSTSELIDWFEALYDYPPKEIKAMLKKAGIPLASTLLKRHQDYNRYQAE